METEKDEEQKFGVANYIFSRLKYYWLRYTIMLVLMTISVVIFLIALSLFSGLQIQSSNAQDPNFTPSPELITQKYLLSQKEAAALSGWLIISAFLLFISSIGAIFNTERWSVLYSKKDIAILKSIGISSKEISRIFVYEALWLSLASWATGFLIGLVLSNQLFFQYYWEGKGAMFFAPSRVMPWLVVLSFLFTFLVAYLGARHPASRASKLDPIEVMGDISRR